MMRWMALTISVSLLLGCTNVKDKGSSAGDPVDASDILTDQIADVADPEADSEVAAADVQPDAVDTSEASPPDSSGAEELCNGLDDDDDGSIDEGFCLDGGPCGLPKCDAAGTCVPSPDGTPCDDGIDCTSPDTCLDGTCTAGETQDCDDENPCTDDSCSPQFGCLFVANAEPCDDLYACTVGDVCKDKLCAGSFTTDGEVDGHVFFSMASEGIGDSPEANDWFGRSVAVLGDLDGDGQTEVAIGASRDSVPGCAECGTVTIASLGSDGLPTKSVLIAKDTNGFPETGLDTGYYFGTSVAAIGDVDGDGVVDLAVGVPADDFGPGTELGAVWVILLKEDGTVKGATKIGYDSEVFDETTTLQEGDQFGIAVAAAGDRNGDEIPDLLVGAQRDDDGGFRRGAFYILFLDATGDVSSYEKFSAATGFDPGLTEEANLGGGIASIGDLDGDGVAEIAVAATEGDGPDTTGAPGVVYILFMSEANDVKSWVEITSQTGGLDTTLAAGGLFGFGMSAPGDLNHDGVPDLIVPAINSNVGCDGCGAVYVLLLNADGTVASHTLISEGSGGFSAALEAAPDGARFGSGTAILDDLDGDGLPELLAGAFRASADTESDAGGVFTLSFAPGSECD